MARIDWNKLVLMLPGNLSGIEAGASMEQIDQTQKTLDVTFERSYIEFLTSVGFLLCEGFLITGICNTFPADDEFHREFDVTSITLGFRAIYEPEFPLHSFII